MEHSRVCPAVTSTERRNREFGAIAGIAAATPRPDRAPDDADAVAGSVARTSTEHSVEQASKGVNTRAERQGVAKLTAGAGGRGLKSRLGATAVATKSTEGDWARDWPIAI